MSVIHGKLSSKVSLVNVENKNHNILSHTLTHLQITPVSKELHSGVNWATQKTTKIHNCLMKLYP